jgi:hypothetical protein
MLDTSIKILLARSYLLEIFDTNTYNYFLRSKLSGASLVKFGLDSNVSRHIAMRIFVYFGENCDN